jgi:DNA-directed RNA polymerase specialized sigma24 family protein
VFIAHEIDGKSFKEIAAETGVNVNTLLSRKRYAVQYTARAVAGDLRRLHEVMRTDS